MANARGLWSPYGDGSPLRLQRDPEPSTTDKRKGENRGSRGSWPTVRSADATFELPPYSKSGNRINDACEDAVFRYRLGNVERSSLINLFLSL